MATMELNEAEIAAVTRMRRTPAECDAEVRAIRAAYVAGMSQDELDEYNRVQALSDDERTVENLLNAQDDITTRLADPTLADVITTVQTRRTPPLREPPIQAAPA
jgi:hypothetical protein